MPTETKPTGHQQHPQGGGSNATLTPTLMAKYRKIGGSFGFYMPPGMREALGLLPGDLIIIRLIGRRAVVSRLDPRSVAPISEDEAAAGAVAESRSRGA